jgi:hypothetical protein
VRQLKVAQRDRKRRGLYFRFVYMLHLHAWLWLEAETNSFFCGKGMNTALATELQKFIDLFETGADVGIDTFCSRST